MHSVHSVDDLYVQLVSCWPGGHEPMALESAGRAAPWHAPEHLNRVPSVSAKDPRTRMMFWDTVSYLPDDILCKVDRAAMATSLETRVPFLDHRVAELAWRMPVELKVRGGHTKWILRQLLYRHVPRALIERPKSGFAIPVGAWLRGPLRTWAEQLLDEDVVRAAGYLDAASIRSTWLQHLRGTHDWSQRLWCVLMFQAWLQENPSAKGERSSM
jgi:asparagine synthase (glutamine-hydrolysing)